MYLLARLCLKSSDWNRCVWLIFTALKYRFFFPCRMKLKYMKLKKYLREVDERQKGALLRNRALLEELDRFEAHLKTSSSAMIQRMEVTFYKTYAFVFTVGGHCYYRVAKPVLSEWCTKPPHLF